MNLVFEKIQLHNFKSIGEATVVLNNRGIVIVKGVNQYESTASSNGSGKTSIFSGLFWALYGKTPEGISNPSNRYNKGICQVELVFSVDSNTYNVRRYMKGNSQQVELRINGEDRSGRNRTDTDKLIKEDILRMSPDIFLSLVYLSQGFGSRLSLLTPTLRKERLEQLTDTAKRVSDFSESVATLESSTVSKINEMQRTFSQAVGSRDTYNGLVNDLERKLTEYANQQTSVVVDGVTYDNSNVASLTEQMNQISSESISAYEELNPVKQELQQKSSALNSIKQEISRTQSQLLGTRSNLSSVKTDAVCPTCNQPLEVEKRNLLAAQYEQQEKDLEKILSEMDVSAESLQEAILSITSNVDKLQLKVNTLENDRRKLQMILSKIPKVQSLDVQSVQLEKQNHQIQIQALSEKISSLDSELATLESKKAVMSHCRQLITKQFRAYLLSSAIEYLNSRLKLYSFSLFSNPEDCVILSADSQKLDITLGTAEYETLSGGEQRRVDLIMMLAQRDLALEVAGMSCNVLIMDEIMESMDETATQSALNLLESQSHSVDSMFIISHNDYSLPIDSIITVTKGVDRIATVSST